MCEAVITPYEQGEGLTKETKDVEEANFMWSYQRGNTFSNILTITIQGITQTSSVAITSEEPKIPRKSYKKW